ncbi:tetratricopeptide repeat protein [Rhodohalobacter sp. SW132]|uniref:serine/threonine-protein kinase n=1 Tax=Rhodohalobacter sp. SW132 TaxID=2293433 RepID=UPI000E2404DC|nr:serine/threonine-protein kinase [Rhodohalobacter sp. SW132]REL33847.1 tetratricopeptide repeat protein [Rhodohalobacter sp. SW132]
MEKLDQWLKIETLIEQSLALPPEKRFGFLSRECGTDEGLRTEIESLLLHSDTADQFIRDISEKVVSPSFEELLEIQPAANKDDELQIIGQKVAHYNIIEKLGSGGMGVVYKAYDTKLNRTVSLKFLNPPFLQSEDDKQHLLLEAQAAAALSHPNICTIYQINEYDGQQFIVMEFIDGVTLREKLTPDDCTPKMQESNASELNIETAIDYSIQIAEALQKAHEKEIIHRDIKPENIMVDSKNRIKVTDFGLAKFIGPGNLTKDRHELGTLAYMSPEQIQKGSVDQRSDIFSLGVVLYEMLTGLHPFGCENKSDTIYSIVNKDPAALSEILPQKFAGLSTLVNRVLEKDPDNRYQSLHHLVKDLKCCAGTLPMLVEAPDTSQYSILLRTKVVSRTVILALVFFSGSWFLSPGYESAAGNLHNSIVVLELENLSPDPAHTYISDSIHEEIINRLAGISSITVFAHSSVTGYPPEERDLQQISEDLGVTTVMEGAVQRFGEKLRVSITLTDTESKTTVWSATYEDDIDSFYDIQGRIAREVAEALEVKLSSDEQNRLDEQLTESSVAYDFYIRALEYNSRPGPLRDHYLTTELLLKRSLEEDPEFAQAYALLAITYSNLYWFFGQTPERLQKIKEAAEQAHLLAPELPETHLALGLYYYWSDMDYNRPLTYFKSALQKFPNHPQLHLFMGLTYRRAGSWEKAEKHLKKALNLDPRNISPHLELSWLYIWTREYDKAETKVMRQIDRFPDMPLNMFKAYINYHRDGSFNEVKTWGEKRSKMLELEIYFYGIFNYYNRDWESALLVFESIEPEIAIDTDNSFIPRLYPIAKSLQLLGERVESLTYYKQIQVQLEELRDKYPNDPRYRTILGKVYARIGESENAIREGEKAIDLVPYAQNTYLGAWFALDLAEIYTLAGKHGKAIDQLEFLLSVPGFVSKNDLQLSPTWDPLREYPEFREIVENRIE